MLEPLSRKFQKDPNAFEQGILEEWESRNLLKATLEARANAAPFVFYEGPPTANGRPGIHHVLGRTLKDTICRFQTMRGKRVLRKAGWDTHGLPVELEVEKQLGISGKPDIEKHGIGPFNEACRNSVFTYKQDWEQLSQRIGFLLDYENPYVTFHSNYVESVWFLLSRFAVNNLLYRGHKVLPWCGRCGTGLSSHEVGLGYKDINDPSVWVSLPLIDGKGELEGASLVVWTTTPWTLPSNMGACVNASFEYVVVEHNGGRFVLLENKVAELFAEGEWEIVSRMMGEELVGHSYHPLFEYEGGDTVHEGEHRQVVVADDYVTDVDGTGIVHLAPYGADDFRIANREGIQAVLAVGDEARFLCPVAQVSEGTFFSDANKALSRDLKERGRLLKLSQCTHSYPHCWRCDTPLIYFPAPAWFLKTSSYKKEMIEENKRIRWAPSEIGEGRFGEWLENNIDWALSRDRYWGTPLPVWVCDCNEDHWHCISSFEELGELSGGLEDSFDPHRPCVDEISFPCNHSECSGSMSRVPQVIDCWFDSGAMPFAQYHWPFDNRETVAEQFPADFIAEGLDQTRGWFYTLHAISVFLTKVDQDLWKSGELLGKPLPRLAEGSAYRSVMVNGLLLDKDGQKMSKRLGNIVVPGNAIEKHGADAIRWSLLSGGAAHLSRRFDDKAVSEVRRRVLGTLLASYDFFALYARTEAWNPTDCELPEVSSRPALDRWILSRATACASQCVEAFDALEPARALRSLEGFIVDELSNWYIRRNRRRFWNSDDSESQATAFATLWEVLRATVRMTAPVAPFLSDSIWTQLSQNDESVHYQEFPSPDGIRDIPLEGAMDPILRASSLGRSVRERVQIRVRQPLGKLIVHVAGESSLGASPRAYTDSLIQELNVKEVEWVDGTPDFLQVRAKPNYPRLGKRAGKKMKALAASISEMNRETLFALQGGSTTTLVVEGVEFEISGEDISMETLEVEGLEATTDGVVTIGLETTLTEELISEGLAREIVNRVQALRRDSGFDVSDRIQLQLGGSVQVEKAAQEHRDWISSEVLAPEGIKVASEKTQGAQEYELPENEALWILATRLPAEVN
ncbi:MAG: isoleucine--tRNA ligase [Planctomycetota bacterium]|jgi:isoleucyl-tRNA synthetase|nr:isoleucine--tRNA ligase [Planctomycetota bacterium]